MTTAEAARLANAAAVKRKNERREKLGKMRKICFEIPEQYIGKIQSAADMDHRTMTNFIYHAAVSMAEKMVGA